MPRLSPEAQREYDEKVEQYGDLVVEAIKDLGGTKVKKKDVEKRLPDPEWTNRILNSVFKTLLEEGRIVKTGSARGRGASWGLPGSPDAKPVKPTQPAKEAKTKKKLESKPHKKPPKQKETKEEEKDEDSHWQYKKYRKKPMNKVMNKIYKLAEKQEGKSGAEIYEVSRKVRTKTYNLELHTINTLIEDAAEYFECDLLEKVEYLTENERRALADAIAYASFTSWMPDCVWPPLKMKFSQIAKSKSPVIYLRELYTKISSTAYSRRAEPKSPISCVKETENVSFSKYFTEEKIKEREQNE
jgi:hypothetical protein